jgi:serine/threonine-protein kinase
MLLNNRYQVIKVLGSGGFGETFLAEDTQMPSKRYCVIKQLKPIHNNPQIYQLVQERFQREAAILEELGGDSLQIPSLYAYFQDNGQFYLVQEFVEGETLSARVSKQGILSESAVKEILISLLLVLEFVHSKGMIHRDIKPDNIILRYRDSLPVLIDFGAVRETMGTVINSQGNSTSSIVIGTPGYMPSEQAMGRPVYSSDLYSLSVTAIYLLTGLQPQKLIDPQTGEISWHQHALNVSPTFKLVIDKAIAYHPRDRFSSAREMIDALLRDEVVASATNLNYEQLPTRTPPEPQNQAKGHNGVILGSLIAGSLIGGSVIAGLILTKSPQPITQPTPQLIVQPTVNSLQLNSFYFVADSAFSDLQTTQKQVNNLQTQGYSQAGNFWIPDYPNLSNQQLFQVYPNKFSNSNSCLEFLKNYVQVNSKAYCARASKDPNTPSERRNITPIQNTIDYSWLSSRKVTNSDLEGKTAFELDIMRNSIYARYGRRFDNQLLQNYFNNQSWYRPVYTPNEFPYNLLSPLEQNNAADILKYQNQNNLRFVK